MSNLAQYSAMSFYNQDTFLEWFTSNLLKQSTKERLQNCYAESGLCTSIANNYYDAIEAIPYVETENENFKEILDETYEGLDNSYYYGHLSVLETALLELVVEGVAQIPIGYDSLNVVHKEGSERRIEVRSLPVITTSIMRLDLLCSSVSTVSNLLVTKRSSKEIYVINSQLSEDIRELGGQGTDLLGDIDRRISLRGVGVSDTKITARKAPEDYKEPKVVQLPESNIAELLEVEKMATATAYKRAGLSWKSAATSNLSLESLLSLREDYINKLKGMTKKWEKFLYKIAKEAAKVRGIELPDDIRIVVQVNRGVVFPSQLQAMIQAKEAGFLPHDDLLIEYGYINPLIPIEKLEAML